MYARRIRNMQYHTVHPDRFTDRISGRSGYIRYNGNLIPGHIVEKRRFARVGLAGNNGADTFLHDPAIFLIAYDNSHLADQVITYFRQVFRIPLQVIAVRVVQSGFNKSQFIQNPASQFLYFIGNCPVQLGQGVLSGKFIGGGNQIHHRFRFRQIDPAAQKGPLGKLSGFSHPGAGCQHQIQDTLHDKGTAMGIDLYRILRRITAGSFHQGDHDFIDLIFLFIHNVTVMNGIGLPGRQCTDTFFISEYFRSNLDCFRSADPDDTDTGFRYGRCDSRYGI